MKGKFLQLACRRSSSCWWPVYLPHWLAALLFLHICFIYYTRTCKLLCMFARMLSNSVSQHHCRRDVSWHLLPNFLFSFFNVHTYIYFLFLVNDAENIADPKTASFLPVYALNNFIGSFIIRVALWTLHLSHFLAFAVCGFFFFLPILLVILQWQIFFISAINSNIDFYVFRFGAAITCWISFVRFLYCAVYLYALTIFYVLNIQYFAFPRRISATVPFFIALASFLLFSIHFQFCQL